MPSWAARRARRRERRGGSLALCTGDEFLPDGVALGVDVGCERTLAVSDVEVLLPDYRVGHPGRHVHRRRRPVGDLRIQALRGGERAHIRLVLRWLAPG